MTATKGRGPGPATDGRPSYPIESVDNALRLLLLVAERKHIRVSEASAELGTAVSTAHRLLAMLAHHGFVEQEKESKAYHAGPVLLRVGLLATRNLEVRTLILPFVERLRDETGETAHAAVLQGNEMLFIACAESPNALRVASRVGTLMYAHCTSIGKAWLASESDDFLRGLYPATKLPPLTDRSVTSRSMLFGELEEVRRLGYAHNEGESEPGVGSVSAAVQDEAGRPLVAISVSSPLARMSADRWQELTEAVVAVRQKVQQSLP